MRRYRLRLVARVGAALIDGLIIGVGAIAIMAVFGAAFSVGFFADDETGIVALIVGLMLAVLAFAIVALLYAPLLMARTNGQTLGRMATGIRVVRANGQPMTFGFAMLREVAVKALLFGFVGLAHVRAREPARRPLAAVGRENRALHDFLVDTRVVAEPRPSGRLRRRRGALGRAPVARPASVQMTWSRPGPDADQRDRHADEVGDVGEVVARRLREVVLVAALGDVLVPAGQLLVLAAGVVQHGLVVGEVVEASPRSGCGSGCRPAAGRGRSARRAS